MAGKITPSLSLENSQQNDLLVVLASPELVQEANRVASAAPPGSFAQSLLSALPPGFIPGFSISEVEDPFVEDDEAELLSL